MEAPIPSVPLTRNYKLRPGKALEMLVKRDNLEWITARDDRVVRCECSCDREELPMVLLGPVTASMCCANMRSLSSNAFAAKNCNIILAMAMLQRRMYLSIIAINVFWKKRSERF